MFNGEQWNTFIEFKPRNPFPEFYTLDTITELCEELGVSAEEAISLLKLSDPKEKTRWFKMKLIKGDYINGNPLSIFNIYNEH